MIAKKTGVVVENKKIKQRRNYYRLKVYTEKTTVYLTKEIEKRWVEKCSKYGLTKKEWLTLAILDLSLIHI